MPSAHSSAEAAGGLAHQSSTAGGIFEWAADVISLLEALDPQCLDGWAVARRALLSVVSTRGGGDIMWHPTELMELVKLADLVFICAQGNRAAPHARDLVGRLYWKSLETGRFFGDVRMTP